jgi:hypothetical protein
VLSLSTPPKIEVSLIFNFYISQTRGGGGGEVGDSRRRAVPCLCNATANTPFPPPSLHEWCLFLGGDRQLAVSFLGNAMVNPPFPPPHYTKGLFFEGDRGCAVPCLGNVDFSWTWGGAPNIFSVFRPPY